MTEAPGMRRIDVDEFIAVLRKKSREFFNTPVKVDLPEIVLHLAVNWMGVEKNYKSDLKHALESSEASGKEYYAWLNEQYFIEKHRIAADMGTLLFDAVIAAAKDAGLTYDEGR